MPSSGSLSVGALQPGTVRYFSGGHEATREVLTTVTGSQWQSSLGGRTTLGRAGRFAESISRAWKRSQVNGLLTEGIQ